MLFARFLKRRQEATAAAKQAIVAHNQDELAQQARHHQSAAKRSDALRQLSDLTLLRERLTDDLDAEVRASASARYCQLFCDGDAGIPLALLQDELAHIHDLALLETLAIQAHAAEIRRTLIERIESPEVLARCAVEDVLAANRSCAVERLLHNRSALEQVAREIGKKDKNVYRAVRERLRQLAAEDERPRQIRAQCEDICAKLERLGRLGNWSQDRALLEHLERQWALIAEHAEPDWQARYRTERDRFLAAYNDICRANAVQIAVQEAQAESLAQREALLDDLATASELTDDDAIVSLCARVTADWNALPALNEAQHRSFTLRYDAGLRAADAARQVFVDRHRNAARLEKLVATATALLAASKPLEQREVKALLDRGRMLAACLHDPDAAAPFLTLAEQLDSRLTTQRRHAEQRLAQLPERLVELETHLAAGELKKADPLYQSLQAGLALIQTSGLTNSAQNDIAQRLRALAPQLRELQHWRRWGADQHREGLCAEMDALLESTLSLEVLAAQLHALQMDWKKLDQSGSPSNQTLWERFHAASDAVYARCRPVMEAQAKEREANRLARERVCQQIEDFLNQIDWERVDWKRILRAERETRQLWSGIGPTEGRHRKALERRFHQSLRQLDQHLSAERKRNQAHKHQLIEQARALAETPDLDASIEQAKALQRDWQTTVPARQKDENRLWQQFRAACDVVFERRAAQHQAQADTLKTNLATREAICAEAKACAATATDPQQLAAALRDFDDRWRTAQSLPVPRQAANQLTRHWQTCRDALQHRLHRLEEQQQQAALDWLQQRVQRCEQLELSLLGATDDPIDVETARAQWQADQTPLEGEVQQALAERFELALNAAHDPAQLAELRQRYATNGEQRSRLCLQLEIITGLPSPAELAQQRLEFQVTRLAERMVEGEDDPLQGATQLLHDWYLCGPAPHDPALLARFERVRQALTAKS